MQNAEPPDHLLQTLAAGETTGRVLDISAGAGERAAALRRLGFEIVDIGVLGEHLPYEDSSFDWVIALDTLSHIGSRDQILDLLRDARRVLRTGGRMYLTVRAVPEEINLEVHGYAGDSGLEATFTPGTLSELASEVSFSMLEGPAVVIADARRIIRAVLRRPSEEEL